MFSGIYYELLGAPDKMEFDNNSEVTLVVLHENIPYSPSLEWPHRGHSNEGP